MQLTKVTGQEVVLIKTNIRIGDRVSIFDGMFFLKHSLKNDNGT